MKHYADQGYEIALDDVGNGHSELNRVVNTTPDYLKADIELVRDIHKYKKKEIMMKLLLDYCNATGAILIAEGIETAEELECLRSLGVHYGQEFFLGKLKRAFGTVSIIPSLDKKEYIQIQTFNNRSKNSITSIGDGMNCTFEHIVTVHSVHSNVAKIHSRLPAAMEFWLVCLGILAYSCQNTSRDSGV